MLIKDEPYVAYLLTRHEKRQRDIAKYGVDVANGDRLVYRHHTSPEFNLGKHRVRFKITTSDWQLNLVRHMKWWRKIPGWHARETAFRDWYVSLLDRVSLNDANYAVVGPGAPVRRGRHRLPRGAVPEDGRRPGKGRGGADAGAARSR